MADRDVLNGLLDALDSQLAALMLPLAKRLSAAVSRAADARSGVIPPQRVPILRALLDDLIAEVFGTAPADQFDATGAARTPIARLVGGATRVATRLALVPLLADIDRRTAGNPQLRAAILAGRQGTTQPPPKPRVDPARTWISPDGYQLSDRLWQNGQEVRGGIDALLEFHVDRGTDAVTLGRTLEKFLTIEGRQQATRTPYGSTGLYAPRRLARTETTRAYGVATQEASYRNPWVAATGWRLSASHPKVDICDQRATADDHGLGPGNYPKGTPLDYPAHPQCFPAGTLVTGPPIEASTQRWYSGDVVKIETARGHVLTVTPNHPILTSQGWVAAGQLHEGGDVISSLSAERMATLVNPNNDYIESLIEEVAITLGGASAVAARRVPVAAEDFHQDGADSEVGIVRTHSRLGDARNATIAQPQLQRHFGRGDVQLSRFPGFGVLALALPTLRGASGGAMRGLGVTRSLVGAELAHPQLLRLGHASRRDTTRDEVATDYGARNPIRFGQRQFGLSALVATGDLLVRQLRAEGRASIPGLSQTDGARFGRVTPQGALNEDTSESLIGDMVEAGGVLARLAGYVIRDCIVQIRVERFSGHVYNLQTQESWYSANSIIAHNCLCYLTPVPVRDSARVVSDLGRWARGEDVPSLRGLDGPLDIDTLVGSLTGITMPGAA